MIADSPVTVEASKVVWNLIRMDLREEHLYPSCLKTLGSFSKRRIVEVGRREERERERKEERRRERWRR